MSEDRDDEFETTGIPGDAVPQRLAKEIRAEQDEPGTDDVPHDDEDDEDDEDEEDEVESRGDDDEEE